ncbi:MAG: M15 family metallopeptidase [Oscillospiraceae bacterium]|nr:M15 family metallopeptidase [Oscillospiraceae bacterium]
MERGTRFRPRERLIPVLAAVLLSAVVLGGCGTVASTSDEESSLSISSENTGSNTVDASAWNLILVNGQHKLPDDFTVKTKTIPGGQSVDKRIYSAVIAMLEDCEKEGYHPGVSSAYRDVKWQTELFNLEVREHLEEGCTKAEAKALAKQEVAEPGTSEHHTGLALDMIADGNMALEESFAKTDVGKWLAKNAYKYGFILRYPKGKEHITGVVYEPWHFRYVGKKAAKEITEQGICLEEYLGVTDLTGSLSGDHPSLAGEGSESA